MRREISAPLRNNVRPFTPIGELSSLSRRSSVVARLALAAVATSAVACSGGEGRSRGEDTTTNQLGGGSSYVPSTGEPAGTPAGGVPAGDGPELLVSNNWVARNTNGVEIQGAFFTYQDPSTRTSIIAAPGGSGQGYCVSGESAEVIDMNFGSTWGAVAALNLNQEEGVEVAASYDAAAHGVVGFGFDIVGETSGALRFVIKQYSVHDGFCINNVPDCAMGCSVEYRIDELTQNCWTPGGATPNASALSALEWQITTKEGMTTPFDYCIENIHAVLGDPAAPVQ